MVGATKKTSEELQSELAAKYSGAKPLTGVAAEAAKGKVLGGPQTLVDSSAPPQPPVGFQPPQYQALDYGAALGRANQQLDPLYQRAVANINTNRHQESLNASQLASATGGAHSGLAKDLQNKVAIAAMGKIADADAQRASQGAQMAQAMMERDQDRADRLRSQAFSEYMGQGQLGLQRDQLGLQRQQLDWSKVLDTANLTGNFNGQQTLAAQNQAWNQQFQTDRAKASDNQWTQSFQFQKTQQEWENNFRQGQFDWQKANTLWEQAFQEKSFEQSVKEAAAARGLQWASLNQREKEFIADQAWKQKSYELDQQKLTWQKELDAANLSWETNPNNPKNIATPSRNQIEADYIGNISQIPANQLANFFNSEKSNIVRELGIDGYNKLYSQYFDSHGRLKSR